MTAAPAPKWRAPALRAAASAREGLAANLRACLTQIHANRARVLAGRDAESLHQLRVGLRRLRATLRAFRSLLRRAPARALDRRLRAVMAPLGEARDWDLFCAASPAPGLEATALRERSRAYRRAGAYLESAPCGRTLKTAESWCEAPPWNSEADSAQALAAVAKGALRRLHRGLARAAEGIDWSDEARRHRVRIRTKRLRYGADCFGGVLPVRGREPFYRSLRALQRVLGELNDLSVRRGLLERLGEARGAGRASDARERRLVHEARKAWRDYEAQAGYAAHLEAVRGSG
jgi:CHAD domain-containing protein